MKGMDSVLRDQTWVHSPTHSKVNLLTLACGEGKCSIYWSPGHRTKESRVASSQNTFAGGFRSVKQLRKCASDIII